MKRRCNNINLAKYILLFIMLGFSFNVQSKTVSHKPTIPLSSHNSFFVGQEIDSVASWYNTGKLTYSEEPFNPTEMTCAHRTLPMQSIILVTNKKNGNSVICRVNDRGPFIRGRGLDVSEGAAHKLNMHKAGTAPVSIKLLKIGPSGSPFLHMRKLLHQPIEISIDTIK